MRILLAIDDSPCSRAAIDSVVSEFRPEHTEVKILHVDEWPKDLPTELAFARGPEGTEAVIAAHGKRLDRIDQLLTETKRRLESAQFTAMTEMRAGDARREILDSAAEWRPDLIVLGSHGRHGVQRFLLGSVSESIVRHADCSVDVVRESQAASA